MWPDSTVATLARCSPGRGGMSQALRKQWVAGELTRKRRRHPSSRIQPPIWQFRLVSLPASFTPASHPVTLVGEAEDHLLGIAPQ